MHRWGHGRGHTGEGGEGTHKGTSEGMSEGAEEGMRESSSASSSERAEHMSAQTGVCAATA